MDVTLIVKASNQQCEDLTIKCEPSWTIRRLKGHLTEVYPGKPSTDEQKLIYSGQLLSDSVVLKDVLRQYEGQQAHTVHLVFTPKNHYYGSGSSTSKGSTSGPSKSSTTGRMSASQSQGTSSGTSVTNNGASSADSTQSATSRERDNELEQQLASSLSANDREGLRQRITRPALRTLPGPPAFMQETAALQNLVQQSYMQYLNQYINLLNAGQNNVNALYSPSGVLPPMGTGAASLQTLTGSSDNVATVPTVPINHTAPVAMSGLPTAYYPCMMPSGSSIPSSMGSFIAPTSLSNPSLAASSSTVTPTAPAQTPFSAPAGPSSSSSGTHSDSSSPTPLATGGETATNTGATAPAAAPNQAGEQEVVAGGEVPAGGAAAAVPAARAARRFPNIVVEEQDNNDWLDVFFSMCRVLILMTVIYLYSSPMRCLTVLVIGVMLYLKKHFDRIYQAVDRRVTNAQQPAAAAPGVQQNNVPEAPLLQPNAPDMGEQPQAAAPAAAEENNQPERSTGADASPTGSSSTTSRSTVPRPRTDLASSANNRTAEVPATTEQREPVGTEATTTNTVEEVAAEGQRMTFNDMTSFLGTLVITFFTSIIPDTPAA
ncbi:mucin-5AC isoform X1 [Anopheles darlingi]|uniref:mucin-5AC isoform X1 n=2 Tax=Anopheles darlingi TaxID=43151 RepID=UPI00210002AD|nr:mucin-5AC isoform X1 [Anopheles darlingi]